MPPRVRLSVANPLPTISEAQEEILQVITNEKRSSENFYINSDYCSSEDYLQSICQLAKPTFPALADSFNRTVCARTCGNIRYDHWLPRLPETQQVNPTCKDTSDIIPKGNVNPLIPCAKPHSFRADPLEQLYAQAERMAHCEDVNASTDHKPLKSFSLCPKRRKHESVLSVPQETAVGKQNLARVFSFPRLNSPRPMQRENSCPELTRVKTLGTTARLEIDSRDSTTFISEKTACPRPPEEKLLASKGLISSQRRRHVLLRSETTWGGEGLGTLKHNQGTRKDALNYSKCSQEHHLTVHKRTLICNWISECRNAWKEAKITACMLPAIAEI
ncbi:uncharacterized protein LOC115079965 isoform X2 [Rhinatrema bivittatum]|nr:uncharacterized protein LOC115079965 isoform X2 [Rhinatrema bivittatum]XP_029439814.1 uncharacterized protein LOC115079965 isoform X2 [Rhinatrema bivittatum]XP_029439815.1 uncharacterized protein LOC115079965 isoform X2 [Rhinatrema bivittatum]XP_029439816.1 uncharacterized protein LOC115079965 isoform X2 [Rhinatrema bivittatum]XP_029439817.1 uncharacterized protein LOC115079965 isoform X2 [Rhinatrema bivittatum]XP_029439818.1 uncharacterized protein LOC115079965 isoform X2 [Rhinatrema bivit